MEFQTTDGRLKALEKACKAFEAAHEAILGRVEKLEAARVAAAKEAKKTSKKSK